MRVPERSVCLFTGLLESIPPQAVINCGVQAEADVRIIEGLEAFECQNPIRGCAGLNQVALAMTL